MVTELKTKKSLRQQAQEEFQNELNAKGVEMLKVKLKERHQAKLILDNLDREIEVLEKQIDDGDVI